MPAEVFDILDKTNILDEYIIRNYDVLHTQGSKYLVDDITSFKNQAEKEWNLDIPADEEKGTAATKIHMTQLRLKLETDRMHQIRIHLAKQGCPIAGDDQHGNFKVNKLLKKYHKIKTLQLCSQKLSIPVDGVEKVFEI